MIYGLWGRIEIENNVIAKYVWIGCNKILSDKRELVAKNIADLRFSLKAR